MRDRSSSVKGDDPSNVLFDTWLTARAAIALLDSALAGTGLDAEDFAVYSVLRQAGEISQANSPGGCPPRQRRFPATSSG